VGEALGKTTKLSYLIQTPMTALQKHFAIQHLLAVVIATFSNPFCKTRESSIDTHNNKLLKSQNKCFICLPHLKNNKTIQTKVKIL